MGMRKYLLIVILLLCYAGVDSIYGQEKPTATVSFDELNFCEDEKTGGTVRPTITISLTGSGTYDFDYFINYRTDDDYDQKFIVRAFNGNLFVSDIPVTTTSTITVKYLHDDNYPKGGESGDIINGDNDITIYDRPTPVINPVYKSCRKEVTLTADPGGSYTAIDWKHSGVGTFISETDTEATFDASVVGDYTFTYEVSNGACFETDDIALTINEQVTPSASFNLQKDKICNDETGILIVTSDAGNRFNLTLNYTDGTNAYSETISSLTYNIALPSDESKTFTMLSLADREGCTETLSENLELTVNIVPSANAGVSDNPICGSESQLGAELTPGITSTGYWTLIDDNGGTGLSFDDNTAPDTPVRLNETGQLAVETYDLRWTEINQDNTECSDTDDVRVEFNREPQSAIMMDETDFYLATAITLEAQEPIDGMVGLWELVDSPSQQPTIELPNSHNTEVTDLVIGNYTFKWTVTNGAVCSPASEEIDIFNDQLFQTQGFSPNGDLFNDTFIIGGAENVNNNKLVVFDVTGKVVYEEKNFCRSKNEDGSIKGWDGVQNNGERRDGTYYYIFTGDELKTPIKNFVIIKGSN